MALVSMTGFAEAHGGRDMLHWRWETKSVNGRGLDLRLRAPPGFDGIEPAARVLAAGRFRRGSVQATLTLEPQEGARGLRVDPVALAAAVKIAKEIEIDTGLAPARVDGLLALKGVVVQDEMPLDTTARAQRDAAVLETLASAFDSLARARATEGAKLTQVLTAQVGEIARLTEEATRLAACQPQNVRDKLFQQVKELSTAGSLSDDRLAQEVALLAVRSDVREELDRLHAHVAEARSLLQSPDADRKSVV